MEDIILNNPFEFFVFILLLMFLIWLFFKFITSIIIMIKSWFK